VLIYQRTGNIRGEHVKIDATVGYLDIEIDDAIEIGEKIDVRSTQERGRAA
jgi:hypothetical protein